MKKETKKLSERAMLTQLTFSVWTGRTKDNTVSDEVTTSKNAEKDGGTWWTYLIPRSSMRNINTAYNKCKATHNRLTLPWRDGGDRILPTAMFMEYSKAMRKVKAGFDEAVNDFLKEYPEILKNAHIRLGKLLDGKTLPSVAEIRGKFGVHQEIYPLPDTTDFRVDLSKEDVADIRRQMRTSIDATIEKAMEGVWSQLVELIEKIEDTLKQPKKVFRDSLISNLKDYCELIPKLNLTGDSKLETFRKEATAKLTKLRPDDLRDDKVARKASHKAAKEVLKKMKDYGL